MMEYKGYIATVEFDDSIGVFHGRVANCGSYPIATFEATDARNLRIEFERSVDEYLAWCEEDGVAPKPPIADYRDVLTSASTADAAGANGLTIDSWVQRTLLLALSSERCSGADEQGWKLERIRVNDHGLLQGRPNGWLDLDKHWEIMFFLLRPPCIRRIEFEPTRYPRNGLKPARDAIDKANHKHWCDVSKGACNESPRDYLALVRPLLSPQP